MTIKKALLGVLIPLAMQAESLDSLLNKVERSPLYKSRVESLKAQLQSDKAGLLNDAWRVSGDLAYADLKDGSDSGTEYAVTLGKDFNLGGSNLEKLFRESENYTKMRETIERNRLRARLWYLYRSYCLTMKALQAKGELGVVYDEMSRHIDKGVRFGEFDASKSIMAHLALENLNLQIAELDSKLQEYEAQIEAIVPFDGQFECHMARPDIEAFFDPENSALWPMLHTGVFRAKEGIAVASNRTPSVGVDGTYTDEIDTRRYTLSLSLPLSFGAKNDAERAAAMHTYEAARAELEAFKNRYAQDTRALKKRLDIYFNHVSKTEASIRLSSDTLIDQSRMRFKAGEASFLDMLKAAETKLQMIETILTLKTSRLDAVYNYLDRYAVDPQGVLK